MTTKKCIVCGKPVVGRGRSITCSDECKAIRHRQYVSKQTKQHKRYAPEPNATGKREASLSIPEINKLAMKHGTTYGQMAAMLRSGVYPAGKFPEGGKQ